MQRWKPSQKNGGKDGQGDRKKENLKKETEKMDTFLKTIKDTLGTQLHGKKTQPLRN